MKRCVIWGTGQVGKAIIADLCNMPYEVVAYCSSNFEKYADKTVNGKRFVSPAELKEMCEKQRVDSILIGVIHKCHLKEIQDRISWDFPTGIEVITWQDEGFQEDLLDKTRKNFKGREHIWNVDFEKESEIWVNHFSEEIDYWLLSAANPEGLEHKNCQKRLKNTNFISSERIHPFLTNAMLLSNQFDLTEGSVVMDLGCGLVSKYGNILPTQQRINLLQVDALAPFYNKIVEKFFPGEKGDHSFGLFEFISGFFEKEFCDLILIDNALDHCIDPYRSIVECLYILKKGGRLHLFHRCSEALFEGYAGLHKWNIDSDVDSHLVIYNHDNFIDITEQLKSVADINVRRVMGPRIEQAIAVEIRKRTDFALEDFLDIKLRQYYLACFIKNLMFRIADEEYRYNSYNF